MADKKILEIISKSKYSETNWLGVFQLVKSQLASISLSPKYYKGFKFSPVVTMEKNGSIHQFLSENDGVNAMSFLLNNNRENKFYLRDKEDERIKYEKKLYQFLKIVDKLEISKLSDKKLWFLLNNIDQALLKVLPFFLIIDGGESYLQKVLIPEVCSSAKISKELALENLKIFLKPEKNSFRDRQAVSLFKIALRFYLDNAPFGSSIIELKKRYKKIYKALIEHQKNYFWIDNGYEDSHTISVQDFLDKVDHILLSKNRDQIEEELANFEGIKKAKTEKEDLYKKIDLAGWIKRDIKAFNLINSWQEEKERILLFSFHYISEIIKEVSRRLEIDYKNGNHLSDEEIKKFLLNGKKPNEKGMFERKKLTVFLSQDNGICKIVFSDDAVPYYSGIFSSIEKFSEKPKDELSGQVICSGGRKIITARVSVVLNMREDRFVDGNILVTSMTRPEFLSIMKKSKVIITNEGGVTSHAAIVSREINIPCIIGTKVATSVLRSGDEVEINLETGKVRMIK